MPPHYKLSGTYEYPPAANWCRSEKKKDSELLKGANSRPLRIIGSSRKYIVASAIDSFLDPLRHKILAAQTCFHQMIRPRLLAKPARTAAAAGKTSLLAAAAPATTTTMMVTNKTVSRAAKSNIMTMTRPTIAVPNCTPPTSLSQRERQRLVSTVPTFTMPVKVLEKGIPGFLSPAGVDISWSQYQKMLVDKLNEKVAGMNFAT